VFEGRTLIEIAINAWEHALYMKRYTTATAVDSFQNDVDKLIGDRTEHVTSAVLLGGAALLGTTTKRVREWQGSFAPPNTEGPLRYVYLHLC
jgi:hypothetical protein